MENVSFIWLLITRLSIARFPAESHWQEQRLNQITRLKPTEVHTKKTSK